MATQRNNNDTKKAAGYFKEKFTIGLSRVTGDEVTRAIMKTTSHMLKAPNEKHLQRLLSATHGHFSEASQKEEGMCRFIIEELEKRSHTHNWIVVLKTMLTFHAFMIDGSDEVNKVLQRNRNIFCGRAIKDLADSPDGAAQQRFIGQYIRYLEERNITQMRIDLEVRIESSEYLSALKMMPMGVLAQALTQLLQQLECIAAISFREEIINNFATLEAHTRLINDGAHLYAFISDRMVYALEHFEELDSVASKESWLTVYKRYTTCIQHLRNLFESMRRSRVAWGSITIPQIKEFPSALLGKLEEEVAMSSGSHPPAAKGTDEVPETEDLSAVLQQEEEANLPPTASNRVSSPPTEAASPASDTTPAPAASVDLFGDGNSQFSQQQQTVAPPPQKPKLPDLDDLFGGPASAATAAPAANHWGNTQQPSQAQAPKNNDFDIFGAPNGQQSQQPAWGAAPSNAANLYGYASSSGSNGSPFNAAPATTHTNAPTPAANDLFGQSHQQQHQAAPTQQASMFGDDFTAINNSSMATVAAPQGIHASTTDPASTRFDPFGAAPRENVFASGQSNNGPQQNMFGSHANPYNGSNGTNASGRPRNDMDDLFGN